MQTQREGVEFQVFRNALVTPRARREGVAPRLGAQGYGKSEPAAVSGAQTRQSLFLSPDGLPPGLRPPSPGYTPPVAAPQRFFYQASRAPSQARCWAVDKGGQAAR